MIAITSRRERPYDSSAMSDGKKRLEELAKKARANLAPTGASLEQVRGLALLDELERDFKGALAMPGLSVKRDPERIVLTRPPRNAEIVIFWDKAIHALEVRTMRHGEPAKLRRCVYDPQAQHFRTMDDERVELYSLLTDSISFALYPF